MDEALVSGPTAAWLDEDDERGLACDDRLAPAGGCSKCRWGSIFGPGLSLVAVVTRPGRLGLTRTGAIYALALDQVARSELAKQPFAWTCSSSLLIAATAAAAGCFASSGASRQLRMMKPLSSSRRMTSALALFVVETAASLRLYLSLSLSLYINPIASPVWQHSKHTLTDATPRRRF